MRSFIWLLITASLTVATSADVYGNNAAPESVVRVVFPTRTTFAVSQTSQLPSSFVTHWNRHTRRSEQTSSEAVIVLNSVIQDGFPNTICGFAIDLWDDLPASPIGLTPAYPRAAVWCTGSNTCLSTGKHLCCGRDNTCDRGEATACLTTNTDNYGWHRSVSSGTIICPATFSTPTCGTYVMDGMYSSFGCIRASSKDKTVTQKTVYGTSEILSGYAGYTLFFASGQTESVFIGSSFSGLVSSSLATTTSSSSFLPLFLSTSSLPVPSSAGTFLTIHGSSRPARVDDSWSIITAHPPLPETMAFTSIVSIMYWMDPVKRLDLINKDAPPCATEMSTKCSELNEAVRTVAPRASPQGLFCSSIIDMPCPGLCLDGEESTDYLHWTLSMCNDRTSENSSTFQTAWLDYDDLETASYLSLFPWKWRLEYNASLVSQSASDDAGHHVCPSLAAKLLAFAIINIVVFIGSAALGRRDFIFWCTKGRLGKPGSRSWPYTALLSIALNLGANAINAALTKSAPGFGGAPIGSLILLWCSRPRMAWAVAFLCRVGKEETLYIPGAVSALLAEVILQIVGAVYIGMTINHAHAYHYLLLHHLDHVPHGRGAHIMYAGALLWMCAAGLVLIKAGLTFTPLGNILKSNLSKAWNGAAKLIAYPKRPQQQTAQPGQQSAEYIALEDLPPENSADKAGDNEVLVYFGKTVTDERGVEHQKSPARSADQIHESTTKKRDSRLDLTWRDAIRRMGFGEKLLTDVELILFLMILPWIGQWLFWVGFLDLAADLYCPPKLWDNTAVWAGFSMFGVFQGASI